MSFALPLSLHRTRRELAPRTTQEPIALDPEFVGQVEVVLPLDRGVGEVAAQAVLLFGAREFTNHGLDPITAEKRARQIAAILPELGDKAGRAAEQRDYLAWQNEDTLKTVNPRLAEGQVAETVPGYTRPHQYVKSGKDEIVHVFEPDLDAASQRVNALEAEAPFGIEAQVTLESLAALANSRPDTMDGSLAAGFVSHIDTQKTHIHLG